MGAQESAIRRKTEELEVGEEYSKKSAIYSLWSHVNPYTKKKSIKGTVFTKEFGSFVDERKYYENGIKHLKQLRHPHIINFVDCNNVNGVLSLLTERVLILDICIDSLTSIEIQSGLSQIREVLIFLHEKARVCHNNISPASIFVTPNGDWKLGGFEFAQSLDETRAPFQTEFYKRARIRTFSVDSATNSNPLWRDYYAFGKLITYSTKFLRADEVGADVIHSLNDIVEKLTSSENVKISLAEIYDEVAFSNDLIEIEIFLSTVHLKLEEEKDEFFKLVHEKLVNLPRRVVARRLSRLFLSRYVLLEARSHLYLYPFILTPQTDESSQGIFPVELFRDYVVPEIVRVFLIRDLSVRCGLLAHFDKYAQYIPVNQLEDFVLNEIQTGAHDVNERLVAQSLQAMATLVPLLGPERVCGWKCSKLFSDGTPKLTVSAHGSTCGSPLPPAPRPVVLRDSVDLQCNRQIEQHAPVLYSSADDAESPQESNVWDDDKDWNEEWTDSVAEKMKVLAADSVVPEATNEPLSDTSSGSIQPKMKPSTSKNKACIGAEFEIAAQSREEDFFADMVPDIKTRGTIIDQLIAQQEELKKKEEEPPKILKFEMKYEELVFDKEAWGDDDDEDWGNSGQEPEHSSNTIEDSPKERSIEPSESQNVRRTG
ncbi:unnamed protein product [Auanema sp. JU1783]|nr:unnamed protein product [Auanema sp. JU1783]